MPKGVPKTDKVYEAIQSLVEAIKALEVKIDEMRGFGTISVPVNKTPDAQPSEERVEETKKEEPTAPFPLEWRDVIDTVLNAKFEATVKYLDAANFELTVIVPKEYSNASEAQVQQIGGSDRRVKVMPNYLGADGIRQYCEKIAENLGSDIRAKIADDRSKLV